MIDPKAVLEGSELYLTIGPFLIHHTWEKGALSDDFAYVIQHYADFLTPPTLVDHKREIHEIPLYPQLAPSGAMNAPNLMTLENQLRPWAARQARRCGGFMCHAAGVINKGKGWLLPGRSGAGKSTLALKLAPKCDLVLSDEVCITLPSDKGWKLWGTPFYGTGEQGVTGPGSQLEAMFFPNKAQEPGVTLIKQEEALTCLLRTTIVPDKINDGEVLADAISLVDSCKTYKTWLNLNSTSEEIYNAVITALSS
jgi:hypothetical protein